MSKAKIHYYDIGDYLSREEKLKIIADFGSTANVPWVELQPNEHGDWISQRNEGFDQFIPIEPEKKFDLKTKTFFNTYAIGVATNRDAWVYNFSKFSVENNMKRMIDFYNEQLEGCYSLILNDENIDLNDVLSNDQTKISWTVNLKKDIEKGKNHIYKDSEFKIATYRPFTKEFLYFDKPFIERPGLNLQFFPNEEIKNKVILITGIGASKPFSVLISDSIPNLDCIEKAQSIPLYYFEERSKAKLGLFDEETEGDYVKRDGVSDYILGKAKNQYNANNISKEDIFYYVYGFLHSPTYRETFANDLKKMLPRMPLVDDVRDFWAFSNAGRKLADLHLNYESVPAYEGVNVTQALSKGDEDKSVFRVEKMRFPKKDQKDTILYNSQITISNIPAEAYEYVVNGKSAIEWIMERYAVTIHKESQIKNDPNDWAEEVGNPRYILDLLLSIINVSVQTVEIVKGLPKVEF